MCANASHHTPQVQNELARLIGESGGRVDYIEVVDTENLQPLEHLGEQPALVAVAAFYGSVRLIDNMEMPTASRC